MRNRILGCLAAVVWTCAMGVNATAQAPATMPSSAPAMLPATRPTTAPGLAPATAPADPKDLELLRRLGMRNVRLHDPSAIIKCKDEYWIFSTGAGVPSIRSRDLITWTPGPRVFSASPEWVAEAVPANRNMYFWAPDLIKIGNQYLLYYSVSAFGKNVSAIGVATNPTLDPDDPDFKWTDHGAVLKGVNENNYNAIDPSLLLDDDGKLWMAFGSFWGGIGIIELSPTTGKRVADDSPMHWVAWSESIEAGYLYKHGGSYYLFNNHGICCRGVNSTYRVLVGRSDKITGPYVDRDGRDLHKGGGTFCAGTEGLFIGPGHAGIYQEGDRYWFSGHFYDGTDRGRSKLTIRPFTWGADGWPVVEKVE